MHVLRHHDVPDPTNAQLGPYMPHPIYENLLDRIVPEELQPAIAGDRQEVNVTVLIVSTQLTRHPFSLPDIVSIPHPSPLAKDGAPANYVYCL